MITDHWPLFGLRVTTPRLELRLPGLDDLAALADAAAAGVHEPGVQPFATPWSEGEPATVARNVIQWRWNAWATWRPDNWNLGLVVVHDGQVIGSQDANAVNFAVVREVGTGSWLGRAHQGRGLGSEMRAAVLHLIFAGLGAETAVSTANLDNAASLAVSRKLGYVDDGFDRHAMHGRAVVGQRLRLDRDAWGKHRSVPVEITGLEPCLADFGAEPTA